MGLAHNPPMCPPRAVCRHAVMVCEFGVKMRGNLQTEKGEGIPRTCLHAHARYLIEIGGKDSG